MLKRTLMLAAALALAPLGASNSQPPPNYDKLKSVLEKKFAPETTRSLAPRPSKKAKEDFQWIEQKDSNASKTPPPPAAPAKPESSDKQSSTSLWDTVYAFIWDKAAARRNEGSSLTAPGTLTAGTTAKIRITGDSPTGVAAPAARSLTPAPLPDEIQVAQAEVPVAKKNSYVIQLKPDAKEEEIAELLQKYGLNVTKVIGALGVITVEIADEVSATRGLGASPEADEAPGGAVADPKKKLEKILEPPIIKELRAEPIVDAAIVNSTIGTKVLPKPSGASLQSGGKTYAWSWAPGTATDGNWGLKSIRMPPVWTILERHRKKNPGEAVPKIGVIDAGFAENPSVPFQSMIGVQKMTVLRPDCATHHAMHVSGIIGARQGETPGVDGMVPGARIDAVAISNQATNEAGGLGVEELWELQTLLFDEVLGKTMDYLVDNVLQPDGLRVINISLGYNFLAKKLIGTNSLDDVEGLKLHIHHQANIIRRMAQRVESQILFVVAAGNDSEDRSEPLPARWASPFAWAGTYEGVSDKPARNILVVEASDRAGARAAFSNTGGHVSAPGVDIMSTLATGNAAFAVCSGTSQASPHAAALAAIMFELDPTKTPSDVIDIIKQTAKPAPEGSGAAPSIDALESVLRLAGTKALLADLDDDGKVAASDLALFKGNLDAITAAATTEAPFTDDLNGDGVVDDNECHWPIIDFNGSGSGGAQPADFKKLGGLFRSDLNVLALAWSDTPDSYELALADSGMVATTATDTLSVSTGSEEVRPCRRKDAPAAGSPLVVTTGTEPATPAGTATDGTSPETGAGTTTADATPGPEDAAPAEGAPPAESPAAPETAAAPEEESTRGLTAAAESPESVKAKVLQAVETLKKLNPRLRITINPATGLPSSITGFLPRPAASEALGSSAREGAAELTDEETQRAVDGFFATSGLTAAFPTVNPEARTAYTGRRRDPDFPDRYIANVEQRVGNIPVFGSSAKLTVEGLAGVTKYVGTPSRVAITDTEADIAEEDAVTAARAKLEEIIKGGPEDAPAQIDPDVVNGEAKASLIIYDPALVEKDASKPTRLAWFISIDSFRLFVDAKTKEVFHYYRDRPTGGLRRIFDLGQGKIFPGTKIIDEEEGYRAEDMSPDAALAFRNTGDVRDFYFLVFGRSSYDDNDGAGPNGGGTVESYIRYSNIRDAFWCPTASYECPNPNVMVFGPGYAESLDIVGHEMTHGVISHEKNLLYLNEPGAVNESLADIFGTLIELHATVPYGNWVIGENAPNFSEASPLRSLADPNLKDADGNSMFDRTKRYSSANRGQPDNYAEVLTTSDTLCGSTRYQDNGCVHFNSGILNKFAYLISEGGEHRGVTVEGIGRFKLARIAYRTMTAQLNESSGLIEAADGFALSCLELSAAGVGSINDADCEQVFSAQQAVGLVYSGS